MRLRHQFLQMKITEGNLLKKSARSTISGASFGRAATPRHVFLFDHLLVICKEKNGKDKEKPFKYKDKLSIRKSDIVDLEDSEGSLKLKTSLT